MSLIPKHNQKRQSISVATLLLHSAAASASTRITQECASLLIKWRNQKPQGVINML